jgi:GNAT superfamily N-acetyltransferase
MPEITFRNAWRKSDAGLVRDAREFWLSLDVLSPEQIDERASELCALAYSEGRIVGASTANVFAFPRLRARFAYYRTMIDPGFRRQRLASRLCVYSRDRLAEWGRENPEEKLKGLFIVLEAEEFRGRQHVPLARQLDLNLVLVGYTPKGYQMRVVWFPDATVE